MRRISIDVQPLVHSGMHQMSPSSLSPFGNRLLQTVLLGFITHLDFLSAQMALVSTFFQMFIVFGMYNFEFKLKIEVEENRNRNIIGILFLALKLQIDSL